MKLGPSTFALLTSVFLHQSAFAVLLAYEGFDYINDGLTLADREGGTGWGGPWTSTNIAHTIPASPGSLGSPAFPFTSIGNRSHADGAAANQAADRFFGQTIDLGAEGVFYASFLFQKNTKSTATSNNNLEVNFLPESGSSIRFGVGSDQLFFISGVGSVAPDDKFDLATLDQTYFVVLKIESHVEVPNVYSALLFDPTQTVPTSEPETWTKSVEYTNNGVLNRIRLRVGTNAAGEYDEFRLGQTWADVTQPSSPPLLPGDFNSDGKVDAADYVVWRKTDPSNQAGYDEWRAHFGQSSPSAAIGVAAVPEPGTWPMLLVGFLFALARVPAGARRRSQDAVLMERV